ncbi:prolyl oligopeptidase family serine peptidase [Streptomyces roseoviridis]|uniref:prolyl oligopeptidase n=1 Tax=Streptomyces roseoviridis TaxID=67361 RepID=A0ABV5QXX5_9ACTN
MTFTRQAAGSAVAGSPPSHTSLAYPGAVRLPVVDELHGRRVLDPYRWLEDDEDPACTRWLDEQERLFAAHAPSWNSRPYFKAAVRQLQELGGAVLPMATPPVWRGPRRFYLHRDKTAQLPVLVVADGTQAAQQQGQVLVDPMGLDPAGLTLLTAWRPSWTGRLIACQLTHRGSESPQLRVLDVTSGHTVDRPLQPGRPTPVAWLPDDTGFFYVTHGSTSASRGVRLHRLGSDPATDPLVFDTSHAHVSVAISPDGRWLTISSAPGAQSGNDLRLADLFTSGPESPELRLIHHGAEERTSALLKFGPHGLLYAVTDADAPYGRVCSVDPAEPTRPAWSTLIAPEPGTLLMACTALTDPGSGQLRLLVGTKRDGAAHLAVHDGAGRKLTDVPPPGTGPGTISNVSAPPGDDTGQVWFTYTDFVTPPAVYRFCARQSRCFPDAPAGSADAPASAAPRVRQLTYRSEDGTPVRLYLIEPPEPATGPRPTILTAYGGFGALAAPAYSPTILAWVRAGGVYAVAQVRGGGERGTGWHAAGSGTNKPNCFADFAAAARHLIDQGITTPDRLAIKGASHSGLVVAAAITRDPDLYSAAVCSDALTDMVRYPHLGMGPMWAPEFGTADNPEHLTVLLGYSPYHQLRTGTHYPAVLLTSPRLDPRVGAAHMRKFTAALQHASASDQPILLRTEADVGHGYRTAARWADLAADTLAFCATHTGLTPAPV